MIGILADYYSAFSALEVQAVLPYFHEPCLFIGPQGLHAAPDYAVLTAAIAPTMEGLRARGYGRSELDIRQLKSLHQANDRWKIAVLIFHDIGE